MSTQDKSYIGDFLLTLGLFGISTLVFLESLKLKPSEYEPLGPAALPRALSIALMLLAVPVLIQGIRKLRSAPSLHQEDRAPADEPQVIKGKQRPLLSLATGISTIVYIIAVQLIGFRISSIVLLVFLGTLLYRREQKGRPLPFFSVLILLAVGMSQLLYFVFTRVLVVNLP